MVFGRSQGAVRQQREVTCITHTHLLKIVTPVRPNRRLPSNVPDVQLVSACECARVCVIAGDRSQRGRGRGRGRARACQLRCQFSAVYGGLPNTTSVRPSAYAYPLNSSVLMLKPSVGLIVSMSSPLNFFLWGGSEGARRGGAGSSVRWCEGEAQPVWAALYNFLEMII